MEDIMEKREKWFREYYGQLEGYTISKFDGMKDTDGVGEDGFEGNGGGFMFVSEYKELNDH